MVKPTKKQVEAGQAIYTKRILSTYDIIVLGISNSYVWRCPSVRIEEHYNKHVSSNHLDVGVGTGYFLARCNFPSQTPRVALMDLNTAYACLAGTGKHVSVSITEPENVVAVRDLCYLIAGGEAASM